MFKNLLKILAVLRRTDFCIAATILFDKANNESIQTRAPRMIGTTLDVVCHIFNYQFLSENLYT